MKKIHNLNSILILITLFIFFNKKTNAQNCSFPSAMKELQGNFISTNILNGGDLFWDREKANFTVPNNLANKPSTIFTEGLWIGGYSNFTDPLNLKVAAAVYNNAQENDYSAGPLDELGNIDFSICKNFDQLWEVYGYEIQQHLADFDDNGVIDNPIENIFVYPAQGNPFFENIHGFALPDQPQGLAPFFDTNGDSIYNPEDGDFPLPNSVHENSIPSHMIWGIFNDAGSFHSTTFGNSVNAEIQLTAWSFYADGNDLLNHTIFTSHKIINRATSPLVETYVGFFTDANLGCYEDDYLGCAPDLNTYYFYNADSFDGETTGGCEVDGYGDNPPVQAVTILNQDMNSFVYRFNDFSTVGTVPSQEFYNYMKGLKPSGESFTLGGNGLMGNQPTSFVFSGNPNDVGSWSQVSTNADLTLDYQGISGIKIENLPSGGQVTIDRAFTFYQDDNLNNLQTIDLVYDNTPVLQQWYDSNFLGLSGTPSCQGDCVWVGDVNYDGIVNTFDVLQSGLVNGNDGPSRNTPLIWSPLNGLDWNNTVNNVNLKHADCDGNGTINNDDIELIDEYFLNTWEQGSFTDIYNLGDEISLELASTSSDFQNFQIKLNQQEDIFGLAMTVEFDPELFKIFYAYPLDPWDDTNLPKYEFQKNVGANGEIHLATFKTDGQNSLTVNDFIAAFGLQLKSFDFNQLQTTLRLKNIKAILNDGTELDYGSEELVIDLLGALSNVDLEKSKIQIFPNPTSDFLNIKIENPEPTQITIFDSFGKKVFEKMETVKSDIQLSTAELPSGVYFITIQIQNQNFVQKFIKIE